MGIDLIPASESDTAILSLTDGEIVRIRNGRSGYGRALYIVDEKGDMYVYAHMSSFSQKIIDSIQIPIWRNEGKIYIDRSFDRDRVMIKKGETIGFLGNSGSGTGDHLHLEVRENGSTCINPMISNIDIIPDTAPPELCRVVFTARKGQYYLILGAYDPVSGRNNRLGLDLIRSSLINYLSEELIDYSEYRLGGEIYDTLESSYECYFYRFKLPDIPPQGQVDLILGDIYGNTADYQFVFPDKNALISESYDLLNDEIYYQPIYSHLPTSEIVKTGGSDELEFAVSVDNGDVYVDIYPGFTGPGRYLEFDMHFDNREGLYSVSRNGITGFITAENKVKLFPGKYVLLRDKVKPEIIQKAEGIFVKDGLSGIDIGRTILKYDGNELSPERDYNILPSGELVIFFTPAEKENFTLKIYDRAGNKRKKRLHHSTMKSLIMPFLNPASSILSQ